jgi:hypothetical protein
VGHLQAQGFHVTSNDVSHAQLLEVKKTHGVPQQLHSCHTGVIDRYVIEGHVPGDVLSQFLQEKPEVTGLAVPGMPIGSPGMEGPNPKPYDVFTFDREGQINVYKRIVPER